ncbi:MAG: methylated-DNA-protein-cysteine methyltransferase related protein [Thermomicrobiales bacterium]|nr:methylated-DNA-protein-cysteine methyltransferase related protein [Thermomicrobiales bacterium]MEA2596249.1 methylated-DNA-protein-cysteine methyltransferase related protein [Thermomicrobiales bacterium]
MAASAIFTERVYDVVGRIPYGSVTTYGDVARAIGSVRGARMVGWALHAVPQELDLPCHRVVNRYGELSGGWHFGHPEVMKGLLVAEGVPFAAEYQVDLRRCLWLPWQEEDSPAADEVDDLDAVPGGKHG